MPNASPNETSYKATALRGSVFVVGAQAFRIFLLFVSLVVLSRLLSPEDFGLYACLTPIIMFISLFQDIGLQQAIVQRPEITDDQLNRIFWIVLAIGVVCAVGLCLISPLIVWFYHEPRLLWLAVAASISLILTSLSTLPTSILNREMRFKALAVIEIIANLLGFVAAVCGALMGLSYWALLLTPFFVALATMAGAFWTSKWKPSRPRFTISRDILGFGANLTGFNFVNFFARNLDNILIGRYSGAQELGFYDRAYKLLMFPLISLNYPLSRVVVPILSRVQNDKERVRRIYLRIVGLLTLAVVPGMAALLAVPDEVILLFFGKEWLPIVPIFCWLGLAGLVQPLTSSCGWLFISQGRAKEMFRWGVFSSATTIASFVIGIQWGTEGLAAAYVISEYLIRLPMLFWYMGKISPVSTIDFIKIQMPLLCASGVTVAFVRLLCRDIWDFQGLVLIFCSVSCSYLFAITLLAMHSSGRKILQEGMKMLLRQGTKNVEPKY